MVADLKCQFRFHLWTIQIVLHGIEHFDTKPVTALARKDGQSLVESYPNFGDGSTIVRWVCCLDRRRNCGIATIDSVARLAISVCLKCWNVWAAVLRAWSIASSVKGANRSNTSSVAEFLVSMATHYLVFCATVCPNRLLCVFNPVSE